MTRKVLLVEIGAGPLPNTTPPTFAPASWFPVIYTPPPPAVPAPFTAQSVADAVLLTWGASPTADSYEVERGPSSAGPWTKLTTTPDLRYTSAEPDGLGAWFRVRAVAQSRFSEYTAPTLGTPTVGNLSTRVLDLVIGAAARGLILENGTDRYVTEAGDPLVTEGGIPGQVVVDCRYSKFRLHLTENVTSWVFVNVADSHELVFEIKQAGAFTIAFPASVVPVSGKPYVPTPVAGAVDVIREITFDGGLIWRLIEGRAEESGGGVFAITLAPSPAVGTVTTDGTTATAPSVQVTATATNGVAPITHAWARADSAGGTDFLIDNTTIAAPTFSVASGTTAYEATQQWRDTALDAGGFVSQELVEVTLRRVVEQVINTFNGALIEAYATGTTGPTGGYASITFHRNGTWEAKTALTVNGSTAPATVVDSGNWHNSPSSTIGDGYEIQFSPSSLTGAGTVANGASSYTALSGSRTFQWTYVRSAAGAQTETAVVAVSLRKISDTSINTSGSVTLEVTGDNS